MRYNFKVDSVSGGKKLEVSVYGASFILELEKGRPDLDKYGPHLRSKGYNPIIIPQGENCLAYLFNGHNGRFWSHLYNLQSSGRSHGAVFSAALTPEVAKEMTDEFMEATRAEEAEVNDFVYGLLRSIEEEFITMGSERPIVARRFG